MSPVFCDSSWQCNGTGNTARGWLACVCKSSRREEHYSSCRFHLVEKLNPVSSISNCFAWIQICLSDQSDSPFCAYHAIPLAGRRVIGCRKMERSAPGVGMDFMWDKGKGLVLFHWGSSYVKYVYLTIPPPPPFPTFLCIFCLVCKFCLTGTITLALVSGVWGQTAM